MNYQALGEYTQFSRQAKDAADRRFALLYNLGRQLGQLSKNDHAIPFDDITIQLEDIRKAEAELRAAVERANSAAALANENPMNLYRLCNRD